MEGESAREELNELEKGANKVGNFTNKAIDKALENNDAFNNAVDKASEKLKKKNEKSLEKRNALKNKFDNSKVGQNVNSAVDKVKNSGAGKMAGAAAGKLNIDPKEMAKNMAGAALSGPKMDESKAGGEIINEGEKHLKKAAQTAIDAVRAAHGDPVAIARIATLLIKIALIVTAILLGFLFMLVAILIQLVGNILTAALFHMSEAFDVVAEALNPTKIESFTMEDQYELLAVAFGESVMEAYHQLEEEVMEEIDSYDVDPTYNEWTDILMYNKSVNKIEYDSIVKRESEVNVSTDVGMPQDEMAQMVPVYIGGYTGIHTDDEFETYSKKLGRYDKGLYKKDSTVYATGEEPYFDIDRVKDTIRSEAAYAAISDMAYLVSGYTVSMNENPILNLGEDVRELQYNLSVISYRIDIQQRILQQNLGDSAELFKTGNWIDAGKTFLSYVFNGEETYFKYSPDLITQISETASRWVYEYHQGIETNCFDYEFEYDIDYKDEDGNSHSKTVTVTYPRSSDIARVTRTEYTRPTASEFDDSAKAKLPDGATDITITDRSETRSNEIWVNRSGYDLTEKFYDSWTLDIPMEAFDVDRMMKALFETSVYWTKIDGYYTDIESTYSFVPGDTAGYAPVYIDVASGQDEVLNYYGEYIAYWKYAYYDMEYDYPGPAGHVEYKEGDQFDNGIDKQPYFQYDEIYIYDCNCVPNFGIHSYCEKCGAGGVISSEIAANKDEYGWGERILSQMNSPLVNDNAYFRFFGMLTGNVQQDLMRDVNQPIKQKLMTVMTTKEKLVLDAYTGDQVGGKYSNDFVGDAGEVVLTFTTETGDTVDYYPITVNDRILQLKDSCLNVLEKTDFIQNLMAKAGLTYAERQWSDTLNWESLLNSMYYQYPCSCTPNTGSTRRCPICGLEGTIVYGSQSVDTSILGDYVKGMIPTGSLTDIDFSTDGTIRLGILKWGGTSAADIVNSAIKENPDKFKKLLEDNGVTEQDFYLGWSQLGSSFFPSGADRNGVRNVLTGLLAESSGIQTNMFNEKVKQTMDYLQNECNITDPATAVLVGSVIMQMGLDNVSDIGKKGELASFNQDVLIGGISAGTDNSLDTTFENLQKWINSGNKYVTDSIKNTLNSNYSKVKADRENGTLPWISNGKAPDSLVAMCEYLKELCAFCKANEALATKYVHYSQGRPQDEPYPRMRNKELFDAIEGFMATGNVYFSSDCSGLISSVFWQLGYQVPGSSGEWVSNRQYAARTDWANIQPGDVVVWRTSSKGHVELYVGPGPQESVGFGSAPPKLHPNWSWHDGYYGASTRRFYRVMN